MKYTLPTLFILHKICQYTSQKVPHIRRYIVAVLLSLPNINVAAEPLTLTNIHVLPIDDRGSQRQYELYVRLPENYDAARKQAYPVVYLSDALWSLELIAGAADYILPHTILVGVSWDKASTPQQSRVRDFSPTKYDNPDYKHPTGEADIHLNFLKNDVFPLVESTYHADAQSRIYFGYSMGGLFGSYILLTQPDTFHYYLIGAPTSLFGGTFIYEYEPIRQKMPEHIHANVHLSVGTDDRVSLIKHTLGLMQFLQPKLTTDSAIHLNIMQSADHKAAFPQTTLDAMYWLNTQLTKTANSTPSTTP